MLNKLNWIVVKLNSTKDGQVIDKITVKREN